MAPEIMEIDTSVPTQQPTAASHPPSADLHPRSDQTLLSALESSSHTFLHPPPSLHAASLVLAKRYLDPLATSTSEAQVQRQQNARRKRKRGESDDLGSQKPLRLREVYLEGFGIDQIWEQARRVLDASRLEVERSLLGILQGQEIETLPSEKTNKRENGEKVVRFQEFDEDGFEVGTSGSEKDGVDDEDSTVEEEDMLPEAFDESLPANEEVGDDDMDDEDIVAEEALAHDIGEEDLDEHSESDEQPKETFISDKLGLNDGFFSIDDFNRQSEFLEQQDARGVNDGAASDEEDVDWDVDPLAASSSRKQDRNLKEDGAEGSDEEEDGPTFGNADLNAPDLSDSDDASGAGAHMEDIGGMNNTNDIKYADFFAPPPQQASKSTRRRPLPKTQPPPSTEPPRQEKEDDVQRTISAVRRDIFEDDLTPDEDEDDTRSSHQKRQAKLTAEIRRLEAAAVAKRDWTLSGEARAADRPINSLLEEDLEFERAGKPIPVITQEVSEDIEALIKRRIIAKDFDEVIRRRPGNLATGAKDARRGRFELEDTKPQQSLAEVYEAEHLKTVDPEGYMDKRDEKLKREHAKIEQMWKDVSAKLDALSSWHYKPKPPSASINVVADVPTISMEDARPAAGGEVGGESMLAPHEVYKPGEGKTDKAEVLRKGSGLPVGREEMTRDEKVRRRRREKERIRKAGGLPPGKGGQKSGKRAEEKRGVIGDLKKGGVMVIGKKGEIRDVEGKAFKGQVSAGKGAGGYKL
ncbi:U3 snoRNP protein [Mycoblastus sanguinarius]|nr:U3 snoRNP protein [Mycoblastus sanguinarius]